MPGLIQKYFRKTPWGFTLVELLIAMAIALVLVAALAETFTSQRKTYDKQEQVLEAIQSARAATDMIAAEVRMAGFDPLRTGIVGIPYTASQLQIRADLDSDGVTSGTHEDITFTFDSNNMQIDRNTGGGAQPLAENIKNFTFSYWYDDGDSTTPLTQVTSAADESEIRMIKITVESRTGKEDPNYTHPVYGDGYRTYTMTTYITPPNLAFTGGTSVTTTTTTTTTTTMPTSTTSTSTTSSTTTTTSTTSSTTTTTSTTSSTTTTTSTSTSTTSSTTTTTTTTEPTTTTTSGGSCELSVTLSASFAENSGGHRHVSVTVMVDDGVSGSVDDAAVHWYINGNDQGVLLSVGAGRYTGTSANTYQKNSNPRVTATATKSGCIPGSGGPVVIPNG